LPAVAAAAAAAAGEVFLSQSSFLVFSAAFPTS
jgi:hypothetical protein